jgi:hypothetical protein
VAPRRTALAAHSVAYEIGVQLDARLDAWADTARPELGPDARNVSPPRLRRARQRKAIDVADEEGRSDVYEPDVGLEELDALPNVV